MTPTATAPGSTKPTYPASAPAQPPKRIPMYASAFAAAPPGSICETVTVLENSRAVSQPRFFTTSPSICDSTLIPPPKPTHPSQKAVVKRSLREGRSRVVERAVARRSHSAVLPRTLLMEHRRL